MSKTTEWYLELEENGTLALYVNSTKLVYEDIEDVEHEVVQLEDKS